MSRLRFDGPCPFLSCLRRGPHEHMACESCGAVNHGNLFCAACRRFAPYTLPPEIVAVLDGVGRERP